MSSISGRMAYTRDMESSGSESLVVAVLLVYRKGRVELWVKYLP